MKITLTRKISQNFYDDEASQDYSPISLLLASPFIDPNEQKEVDKIELIKPEKIYRITIEEIEKDLY